MTRTLALAATLIVLATPGFALDCPEGMRAFAHAAGEDCIPRDPQRIVTLQDQNALLPLLELGVRPVGSAGHIENGVQVYRRTAGYDTTGITFVGSYGGADREAVAALEPDLIVGTPYPAGLYELYSPVAPTVVIDMFNQPLDDALMQFADLAGRTEEAEDLREDLRAQAAATRAALGDRFEETTVSVINYWDGNFWGANPVSSFGMIQEYLGLVRPDYEAGLGSNREHKSWETLVDDHSADVMVLITFADQGGEVAQQFLDHPAVRAMPVSQAGQIFSVDGTEFGGASWGAVSRGLEIFSGILLRQGLNRDLVIE